MAFFGEVCCSYSYQTENATVLQEEITGTFCQIKINPPMFRRRRETTPYFFNKKKKQVEQLLGTDFSRLVGENIRAEVMVKYKFHKCDIGKLYERRLILQSTNMLKKNDRVKGTGVSATISLGKFGVRKIIPVVGGKSGLFAQHNFIVQPKDTKQYLYIRMHFSFLVTKGNYTVTSHLTLRQLTKANINKKPTITDVIAVLPPLWWKAK